MSEGSAILSRLQEDLSLSRNIEDYLRTQLNEVQTRMLSLYEEVKSLYSVKDKVAERDAAIQKQLETLEELQKVAEDLRTKVKEKLSSTITEKEILNKVNELNKKLKDMDSSNHLLRIEHQVVLKQKDFQIKQLEDKIANLSTNTTSIAELNQLHVIYKNRIMDLEQRNRNLENSLNALQGRLAQQNYTLAPEPSVPQIKPEVRKLWDKKINVTWADAARKAAAQADSNSDRNSNSVQHNEISSIGSTDSFALSEPAEPQNMTKEDIQQPGNAATFTFKPKFKQPRGKIELPAVKAPIYGSKDQQSLQVETVPGKFKPKRKRLYTSNNNHFLD